MGEWITEVLTCAGDNFSFLQHSGSVKGEQG